MQKMSLWQKANIVHVIRSLFICAVILVCICCLPTNQTKTMAKTPYVYHVYTGDEIIVALDETTDFQFVKYDNRTFSVLDSKGNTVLDGEFITARAVKQCRENVQNANDTHITAMTFDDMTWMHQGTYNVLRTVTPKTGLILTGLYDNLDAIDHALKAIEVTVMGDTPEKINQAGGIANDM